MAAGIVTLNILDGDGNTRTARFMSSDGTVAGTLKPVSVAINSDETIPTVDLGPDADTLPATDNTPAKINGRLIRIAQRITSLIALVPASLGRLAAASSFGVALSTEDKTAIDLQNTNLGAINETAPASDTASAGHNGRLQRIAQRLTSLIALLPSAIGTRSAATSLAVALSTEDAAAQTTAATARGAPGDAAWASGSGSMIALLKAIAAQAVSATAAAINLTQVNGNTLLAGNGATGTGSPRVTLASDTTMPALSAGSATIGRVLVGNVDGREYETVAASQTAQPLGATGATGDDIDGILVIPATAGCGVVTLLDNATSIPLFVGGGTTALSNLIPFYIPLGMRSVSGAWKITTGANVSCIAIGNFT